MGDASHQARESDHNCGNAVDITHDPARGLDCNQIAEWALYDPRTKYVIYNRRVNYKSPFGWDPYTGQNAHNKHCHISIRGNMRDQTGTWPWLLNRGVAPPPPPTNQNPRKDAYGSYKQAAIEAGLKPAQRMV
jgi:hypothetical protein